ncbi:hypothetical protein LCGC14_0434990 [marine sediment metagenome]|uniref:Uncharacterized protein n=1 Tax=marine sediment metagenome TaxID=412755 RepID=A0A0F9T557_9ZZZZ
MKKLLSILLIPLLVFAFSGIAFGWGSTGGDGERYTQIQETAVFFNNTASAAYSDFTVYHGQAVILDLDGSDVSSGTTLGAYVEKPGENGSDADSILVVGVAQGGTTSGWLVSRPIVVITKGAALTQVSDLTDAITSGSAVGTAVTGGGNVGGGTNLGIALEAGDGTDADEIIIWVAPAGSGD